jgi:protein translocase SecG subunit
MQQVITIAQIVVSVLLIAAILLQQRGVGLGATFGGGGEAFRTKRGLEKGLFYATIVLSVVFLGLGLAIIVVSSS